VKRVLIITAAALGVLVIVAGFAFAFGTPQAPDVAAQAAASGEALAAPAADESAAEEAALGDGALGADGQAASVPEPDPSVPLAIEIPGCVCHSDDPKIVEEHSNYRMNQCAGCHAGETPTGM